MECKALDTEQENGSSLQMAKSVAMGVVMQLFSSCRVENRATVGNRKQPRQIKMFSHKFILNNTTKRPLQTHALSLATAKNNNKKDST